MIVRVVADDGLGGVETYVTGDSIVGRRGIVEKIEVSDPEEGLALLVDFDDGARRVIPEHRIVYYEWRPEEGDGASD